MGIYEVFLRDDRGRDKSTFNLKDEGKVCFSEKVEIVLLVLMKVISVNMT